MATSTKQRMKKIISGRPDRGVLFKPNENVKNPIVTGFYLKKRVYVELGSPDKIELTIEAVD